jgi:hypothetical protein
MAFSPEEWLKGLESGIQSRFRSLLKKTKFDRPSRPKIEGVIEEMAPKFRICRPKSETPAPTAG